jgi:hypothetical protein
VGKDQSLLPLSRRKFASVLARRQTDGPRAAARCRLQHQRNVRCGLISPHKPAKFCAIARNVHEILENRTTFCLAILCFHTHRRIDLHF